MNQMKETDSTASLSPELVDQCLKAPVQALKLELSAMQMPAAIEQQLLAQFKQLHKPLPWYRRWSQLYWQMASGFAVAILTLSVSLQTVRLGKEFVPAGAQGQIVVREDIPFLALGSGEEIAMQDNMRIVQAEVPHSVLASMGVGMSADQMGGSSTAEMLYGANDEPLAVRFVPK